MRDTGFELLRLSPVTRFTDPAMLAEEVRELESDGYRCIQLDCSVWVSEVDFHTTIAAALGFPDYYGRNLAAFKDCLWSIKIGDYHGMVLVFSHWDSFARVAEELAWHILDIIAGGSRFRLVYGDRLLAMLEVGDSQLQFKPIGSVGVVLAGREWRSQARTALARARDNTDAE